MQFVSHARHSPSDHNSSVGGARAITVGRLCPFPFDNTHAAIADTSAATRTGRRSIAAEISHRSLAQVQPQIGFAMLGIGAVAIETIARQDWPHVLVEADFFWRGTTRHRRGKQSENQSAIKCKSVHVNCSSRGNSPC